MADAIDQVLAAIYRTKELGRVPAYIVMTEDQYNTLKKDADYIHRPGRADFDHFNGLAIALKGSKLHALLDRENTPYIDVTETKP